MKTRTLLIAAIAAISFASPFSVRAEDAPKQKGPFMMADKDGDGKVSLAEFTAWAGADAMGDKKMSADAAKAKFAELDADKDGFLTRKEMSAMMPSGKGKMKGKMDGKMDGTDKSATKSEM